MIHTICSHGHGLLPTIRQRFLTYMSCLATCCLGNKRLPLSDKKAMFSEPSPRWLTASNPASIPTSRKLTPQQLWSCTTERFSILRTLVQSAVGVDFEYLKPFFSPSSHAATEPCGKKAVELNLMRKNNLRNKRTTTRSHQPIGNHLFPSGNSSYLGHAECMVCLNMILTRLLARN